MANRAWNGVLRQVHAIYSVGTFAGLSDGQLLERFTAREGEAAELAFAALVERHGPMVYSVCRRLLHDSHDAQDAFQATFLVLVRKAGSLRDRGSMGNWLYGVASRVALQSREASSRRRRHEAQSAERDLGRLADDTLDRNDWNAAIHEELLRLPERYREPVILCHLEGLTHEEAALRLGRPVGTVRSRLARGRDRLRGRLVRRGIVPATGAIATALSADVSGAMPRALLEVAVRNATRFVAGRTAAGTMSAAVTELVRGELRIMLMTKFKSIALAFTAIGTIATGAGALAYQDTGKGPAAPTNEPPSAQVKSASPSAGRVAAVEEYLDKTRKEVDAAVTDLRAEVADLRAKLEQAEANLHRLESLKNSLDDKGGMARYDRAKTPSYPSATKYADTGAAYYGNQPFAKSGVLQNYTRKPEADKQDVQQRREAIDQQIKRLTDEKRRLGDVTETPK